MLPAALIIIYQTAAAPCRVSDGCFNRPLSNNHRNVALEAIVNEDRVQARLIAEMVRPAEHVNGQTVPRTYQSSGSCHS